MSADAETLEFYRAEATGYAAYSRAHAASRRLAGFAAALPAGAAVLDLGCGAGHAARWLAQRGFAVTAMDPVAEILPDAASLTLVTGGAGDLAAEAAFDGIWSNCALQHLPRDDMPDALDRIARALKPGGLLALAIHEGDQTLRDRLGRLYCHWTAATLTAMLADRGLAVRHVSQADHHGFDGRPITVLRLDAVKHG